MVSVSMRLDKLVIWRCVRNVDSIFGAMQVGTRGLAGGMPVRGWDTGCVRRGWHTGRQRRSGTLMYVFLRRRRVHAGSGVECRVRGWYSG